VRGGWPPRGPAGGRARPARGRGTLSFRSCQVHHFAGASHVRLGYCERGSQNMAFQVGDTVVYPHHGAATVQEIKTRAIKGVEKLYLKLQVSHGDLVIEVPAENCDLVGVRDVVGEEGLEKVFQILRADVTEEPTNWSRRYKANLEKFQSGDVIKVAEVVRDLWRREQD